MLLVHVSTVEKILDPLLNMLCDNGSDGIVCGCGVCCRYMAVGWQWYRSGVDCIGTVPSVRSW